jgi:hypothetical protein
MSPGVEELIVGATSAMAGNVALSIAELYDEVEGALVRTFPRTRALWVRGEVQSLSDRTGHCYMDLVDPESAGARQAPTLKVKCWKTTWGPLKATLAREGIDLQPGMVVALRGSLDFYRPRSEIGFILAEIDVTALLGRMAAERAALLRALAAEGLLKANSERPLPDVPLRVGLIGSPGTEGFADFLGQLDGSALAFDVRVVRAAVQGPGAAREVARALDYLAATDCDVVEVAARRPISPHSTANRSLAPSLPRPSLSGLGSGTQVMSRWPTSWPTGPSSRRPSAGVSSHWLSGTGGSRSPTPVRSSAGGRRTPWLTPSGATPPRASASPRRHATS